MSETKRKVISTRDLQDSVYSSVTANSIQEFIWEDTFLTLRELICHYNLPLTVKLKASDVPRCFMNTACGKCTCKDSNPISLNDVHSSKGASEISATNLGSTSKSLCKLLEINDAVRGENKQSDVVLQIHEIVRKKIILARKMTWDKRQNDYVVTGGQMEIPASVRGWVEVLPENGRPVEYYDTIDGITSLNPKRFLVRTSTVGYQLTTGDSGNCCWMPWEIKPGEILTTGIIYVDSKRNKSAQKSFLKKLWKHEHAKKEEDVKYLQCFDSSGSEIMIPLFMSGVFSPVGDSTFANYDAVYEFQDLIMAFGLPVNVQLVYANATESIQCPRGVIRLYGIREEEVAIVSRIGQDGDLFRNNLDYEKFEMPIDSEMLFFRGILRKKTSRHSKAVNGYVILDEQIKLATCKKEESKMKTNENIANMPMKKFPKVSDQRDYLPVNETAKYTTTDSPPYKQGADVNHNNIRLQKQTVTNQTPEPDTAIHEHHSSSNRLDSTQSQEQSARDVELPEKAAKEPKSRPSHILEKLSVRKVKKVRAKLKELRSEDVFSKRLSRSELTYQDFSKDLEHERKLRRDSDYRISMHDNCKPSRGEENYQTSSSNERGVCPTSNISTLPKTDSMHVSNTTLLRERRSSMQRRELPPVPSDSSENSNLASSNHSTNLSKESEYEQLPQAPQLPHFRRASDSAVLDNEYRRCKVLAREDSEDDYMLPIQMQQGARYVKRSDVQLHYKQLGLVKPNISVRGAASKEADNGQSSHSIWRDDLGRSSPLDVDDLFNFPHRPTERQHKRHVSADTRPTVFGSRQVLGAAQVPEWTLKLADNQAYFEQTFLDNLNIETRNSHCASRRKSRHSKHTIINPNATLRSHNLRHIFPNVKDVFPLHDSHSPMCDNAHNHIQHCSYQQCTCSCSSRPLQLSNHSADNTTLQSCRHHFHNLHDNNDGIHYSETDASFQPNRGASFAGDFRGSFNQGDDSAISACSRGDVCYNNDSEYNSNNFEEHNDDGWLPPDQIEGLSVREVSKSLRYIGMKDRVVLRFSKEQIDGSMLCTLDEKLLKEGFPELNALEVKKILDFILGWRPKKS